MKIDKINFYAPAKTTSFAQKKSFTKPNAADSVYFTGKHDEKISLWDKITGKHKISKKETTPEYEKSEDIKYFLGSIEDNIDEFKKQGKYLYSFTSNEFKIAMMENFQGRVKTSKNETVLYSDFDKSTGMPKEGEVRLADDWTQIKRKYRFYDDNLERYDIIDYTNPAFEVIFSMNKKDVINYKETEKATGIVKELTPRKGGFHYFEGKIDENGSVTKMLRDVECTYDINGENIYLAQGDDDKPAVYIYNKDTDMWEQQELLSDTEFFKNTV